MTPQSTFFTVTTRDTHSSARLGCIVTAHGLIETPAFMPVGTQATVKTLDTRDLYEINADVILGNTYHLHLRPGEEVIAQAGGMHKFMGWNRAILTDSGGFQVWSLGHTPSRGTSAAHTHGEVSIKLVNKDADGVTFRSHIDGSAHRFTPEIAIDIQKKIGADIVMAFDECTADNAGETKARETMETTHAWAGRCIEAFKTLGLHPYPQALFGIIQGGRYKHLREESARVIASLPFDGIAIGGETVGHNMAATREVVSWVLPYVRESSPRYTMGVGASVCDMLAVAEAGIDMFDCVAPTRMARNGALFCRDTDARAKYRIAILNAQYKNDPSPISTWCTCKYCRGDDNTPPVSRRYLHHLFKADEILGLRIASYHNLYFVEQFMAEMRESLRAHAFVDFKKEWIYETG